MKEDLITKIKKAELVGRGGAEFPTWKKWEATKKTKGDKKYVICNASEGEIGLFMQFKMIEMMYLGHLFEVNAFDQPHVELYKIETKRILE